MLPSLRTIFLAIVGVILIVILVSLAWSTLGLGGKGADSRQIDFASLLSKNLKYESNSPPLDTGDPAVKQWVVFYRGDAGKSNCIYGVAYRAHSFSPDRAQVLLPWRLAGTDGKDLCLGTQRCEAQTRELLNTASGPELVISGYQGALVTQLSLFYWPGLTGQSDIADLRYIPYRSFAGDRGVRFQEDTTTVIVKKTIADGGELLARNSLCQFEVYEQAQDGSYPIQPTRSVVRFQSEQIPTVYPTQPEEVVVAFCLAYHDEAARKRYLDPDAKVELTPASGFGCMGPTADVEVLELLTPPPSQIGNLATVRVRILVGGQQKDTTWSLRYAEGPGDPDSDKRVWRWWITTCSSP